MERIDFQHFPSLRSGGVCMCESCEREQEADFTTVYSRYYRRVLAWCLRMTRKREDAEDLTQEAFIQVMRKIHAIRREETLSEWLYRVTTNTVLMWSRRKRFPETSLDGILES
jgi:RNA polymerase sigma-70 factor (ECF subfamily)